MNKVPPKLQNEQNTEYAGIQELWASEKFLQGYNVNIITKLAKFSNKASEVLEFGAGLGTLASIWRSKYFTKPECLEIDSSLRGILVDRGFVCYKSIDEIKKSYDIIYSSNVLEHIENDLEVLKKIHSQIKENGYLALYLPAFMCLYNEMDLSIGHYRRYGKKEISEKLIKAGFKIKECYYCDSIGFFAWLYLKLRGYGEASKFGAGNNLGFYDKYIFPLSSFMDNLGFKYLFGKNIVIIGLRV